MVPWWVALIAFFAGLVLAPCGDDKPKSKYIKKG